MELTAITANDAWRSAIYVMRDCGVLEHTRNGPALTIKEPVTLKLLNPRARLLTSNVRRANPIFHLMETVWMFAGCDSGDWLLPYNSKYSAYMEDDGRIHGAYGHRWRKQFGTDQLRDVVDMLRADGHTRQAVLGMWDPRIDLAPNLRDRPCNTHIYFRRVDDELDMTVCNRSNDLVWGMLGANIVHMTLLHELIAEAVRVPLGTYRVFTNNLHFYTQGYHNQENLLHNVAFADMYRMGIRPSEGLFTEDLDDTLDDCKEFVYKYTEDYDYRTDFMKKLVLPAQCVWEEWKGKRRRDTLFALIMDIGYEDWREACRVWAGI